MTIVVFENYLVVKEGSYCHSRVISQVPTANKYMYMYIYM